MRNSKNLGAAFAAIALGISGITYWLSSNEDPSAKTANPHHQTETVNTPEPFESRNFEPDGTSDPPPEESGFKDNPVQAFSLENCEPYTSVQFDMRTLCSEDGDLLITLFDADGNPLDIKIRMHDKVNTEAGSNFFSDIKTMIDSVLNPLSAEELRAQGEDEEEIALLLNMRKSAGEALPTFLAKTLQTYLSNFELQRDEETGTITPSFAELVAFQDILKKAPGSRDDILAAFQNWEQISISPSVLFAYDGEIHVSEGLSIFTGNVIITNDPTIINNPIIANEELGITGYEILPYAGPDANLSLLSADNFDFATAETLAAILDPENAANISPGDVETPGIYPTVLANIFKSISRDFADPENRPQRFTREDIGNFFLNYCNEYGVTKTDLGRTPDEVIATVETLDHKAFADFVSQIGGIMELNYGNYSNPGYFRHKLERLTGRLPTNPEPP